MPQLPSALECFDTLINEAADRQLVFFLDYDGTLTPIVAHPEDAVLSESMRRTVEELSERFIVAVVSGRDRADVAERVRLADLIYAGSHGFDISGPDGLHREHPRAVELLPELDAAAASLEEALADISGSQVDRKRFAIAVHYRNVDPEDAPRVEAIVDEHVERLPNFKKTGGKKVFELKPNVDWHKGRAVLWLMEALGLGEDYYPIYIGDDVTDEDAFEALAGRGLGVLVGPEDTPTKARYVLADPDEVRTFLDRLH